MKLIAFWSPNHGTGTTMDAVSVAMSISMDYDIKTLLMHNQYVKSNMESAFLTGKETESILNFDDKGIDAIERLAKSGHLNSDNFGNYTTTIIQNRLEILTGTTRPKEELFARLNSTIDNVLYCAKDTYELVFIDTNSGVQNEMTNKILELADIVIICLAQNESLLNAYFRKEEYPNCLENKKSIVLLGKYDPSSKYSAKYIRNAYNYKEVIYMIPYNTEVMDSHNDHAIREFFYLNNNLKEDNENYYFMSMVKKFSEELLEILEIDAEEVKQPIVRTSFKDALLNIFR